jgi:hypothetical protein
MENVSIVGLDIAKNLFHAHGAAEDGSKVFSKALPRGRVLEFFGRVAPLYHRLVSLCRCASLKPGAFQTWSRCQADRPTIRQTLREAAKERCERRCGHH